MRMSAWAFKKCPGLPGARLVHAAGTTPSRASPAPGVPDQSRMHLAYNGTTTDPSMGHAEARRQAAT